MRNKRRLKLASSGKRLGAYCIDMIIPAIITIVCMGALLAVFSSESGMRRDYWGGPNNYGYGYDYGYGYGYGNNYNSNTAIIAFVVTLVLMLLLIAYMVVQIIFFRKAQTLGKAILGLQVISSENGKPISFWKMMLREWIVKRACYVFYLGFIWILIDEKNRGWHDKILDTFVIDLKESNKLKAPVADKPQDAAPAYSYPADQTFDITEAQVPAESVDPEYVPADIAEPEVTREESIEFEAVPEDNTGSEAVQTDSDVSEAAQADTDVQEAAQTDVDVPKVTSAGEIPKVNMTMKKDELIDAAAKLGIEIDPKMTKARIIEEIEKLTSE